MRGRTCVQTYEKELNGCECKLGRPLRDRLTCNKCITLGLKSVHIEDNDNPLIKGIPFTDKNGKKYYLFEGHYYQIIFGAFDDCCYLFAHRPHYELPN